MPTQSSHLIPYRRQSILSHHSSFVSKNSSNSSHRAERVLGGVYKVYHTRRKPDVHWKYKTQRQVPVKTTVVNVDRRVQLLDAEKRAKDAKNYVKHKNEGSLGFLPTVPSTETPSKKQVNRSDDIFSQLEQLSRGSIGQVSKGPKSVGGPNKLIKTNLRTVKARLNAVYRAKIPSLGISFKFVLTPEEKMYLRRQHFRIHAEPVIPVQPTKTSELKEEFSSYCGRRAKIRNWLFYA